MNLTVSPQLENPKRASLAFSLPEILVSVMFVSLYAGMSQGFAIVTASREHRRATQIILEKTEVIRMCTWDQLNSPGFVPTTFTERYAPTSVTNAAKVGASPASGSGVCYYGSVSISTNTGVAAGYQGSMRKVTITLNWTNGSVARSTSMDTLVSQYGLVEYTK